MNVTEKVQRAIRKEYLPKLDELVAAVADGLLTIEEAQACAAGALLKIWDAAEYEPVTSLGKHDCALYNAKGDLAFRSAAARTLGSARSERKAIAARENGKRGGRPRKQQGV